MSAKVSVYLPTKNRLSSLKQAVDSVLGQSYNNIELIVVDDASSDETSEYLDKLKLIDSRVLTIRNQFSMGGAGARNEAIKRATGYYLTGLDDDDVFDKRRIEIFVSYWRLLESFSISPGFLYSQDIRITDGKRVSETKKMGGVELTDMFYINQVGNQIFSTRDSFFDVGLFDQSLPAWQDMELFIRFYKYCGRGYLVDIPTQVVDTQTRGDRVSNQSYKKLYSAFKRVADLHVRDNRDWQNLYLQMFSDFYGHRPGVYEFFEFLRHGFWIGGLARLIRAKSRRFVR